MPQSTVSTPPPPPSSSSVLPAVLSSLPPPPPPYPTVAAAAAAGQGGKGSSNSKLKQQQQPGEGGRREEELSNPHWHKIHRHFSTKQTHENALFVRDFLKRKFFSINNVWWDSIPADGGILMSVVAMVLFVGRSVGGGGKWRRRNCCSDIGREKRREGGE